MQPFEDQDPCWPEDDRRVERSRGMVIDRFLDRHPAPEHDEVLFKQVDTVGCWVECCQSLPLASLAVEAVVIVKGDGGDKIAPEDIADTLRERGLPRSAVTRDTDGEDIG